MYTVIAFFTLIIRRAQRRTPRCLKYITSVVRVRHTVVYITPPDQPASRVCASNRLLCVPEWVLSIAVGYMYTVLAVKTPIVGCYRGYHRGYCCLRHGGVRGVFGVYEIRRPERYSHLLHDTSRVAHTGREKRRRGLADFDSGKRCDSYSIQQEIAAIVVVLDVVVDLHRPTQYMYVQYLAVGPLNKHTFRYAENGISLDLNVCEMIVNLRINFLRIKWVSVHHL